MHGCASEVLCGSNYCVVTIDKADDDNLDILVLELPRNVHRVGKFQSRTDHDHEQSANSVKFICVAVHIAHHILVGLVANEIR